MVETSTEIIRLANSPQYLEQAALWFAQRWGISVNIYRDSIRQSIAQKDHIPQWYIVIDQHGHMIAGCGVIDNDFHERTDLTPNLCALWVEPDYRGKNIAKQLLDAVRKDIALMGFAQLYLITDHTTFYEKCGWTYLYEVKDDEGEFVRMYMVDSQND